MTLADLGCLLHPKRQRCPGVFPHRWFGEDGGCHGFLILRMNRNEKTLFWGCSTWPQCRYGKPFNALDLPYDIKMALIQR